MIIFGSLYLITGINRHEELRTHKKGCDNEKKVEKTSGVGKKYEDEREGHRLRNAGGANKL